MAQLYYGAETRPAEIPDHVLAHVKVLAATKLRRGESFMLTWRHGEDPARGRTSVWMQPSIPLRFVFDGPEPETLDREYLRTLAEEAMSSRGVVLEWDDEAAGTAGAGSPPEKARPVPSVAA
jgi:hypothetical protein